MPSHQIKGKHIVITGGTSGIGLELIKQLYPNNQITVLARPSERLSSLARSFPDLTIHQTDLSDLAQTKAAIQSLLAINRTIDVLINNAAVQYSPIFTDSEFDPNSVEVEVNTNLSSPILLIDGLIPLLQRSSSAMIININSGLGLVPKTTSAVYCATKGGLNIMSQSLHHQLAPLGIHVGQAFVPLVETPMTEGRGSDKILPQKAAADIISGIETKKRTNDIVRVKLFRVINRISPNLAARIMKKN